MGCLAQYFNSGRVTVPVRPEAYIAQPREMPGWSHLMDQPLGVHCGWPQAWQQDARPDPTSTSNSGLGDPSLAQALSVSFVNRDLLED